MSIRTALTLSALLAASLPTGCMRASATPDGTPLSVSALEPPKLIVVIAVDQLRGDMLQRYSADMKFGFRRLMRGAWFVNAFQDHAITETAPGHATMLSGRFPRGTGIVSNNAGVADRNYRLVDALPGEWPASPHRFTGTTLFDWLKAKDSRTRAVSVSMKDRSAILMIGRAKEDVYWYSYTGGFTTSTYYRDSLPRWVRAFNERRILDQYIGGEWRLSRRDTSYTVADSIPFERHAEGFTVTFPHRIPTDPVKAAVELRNTPAIDSMTALLAIEGLRATGIGRGPHTDLLTVSFSATDRIGHEYGPDSREAYENQMRLDETLGWFLDSLYHQRDSSTVLIAVTGDHGVQPNPDLARIQGLARENEGRVVSLAPQVAAIRAAIQQAGADPAAFRDMREIVSVDRGELRRVQLDPEAVLRAFATAARQVPGVARVDRVTDLRRADPAVDPVARRWMHQIVGGDTPADLVITLTRYSLWYEAVATHGSPYDLDAHVPLIFYGPWARPGRYSTFARVVDLAPTLAGMARVRPLEKLDGLVLGEAIR